MSKSGIFAAVAAAALCATLAFGAPKRPKAKAKPAGPNAETLLTQARQAYLGYDFGEAASLAAQAKKKAPRDNDSILEEAEQLEQRSLLGRNFLGRVEKLQILDSIAVPREQFFKAYLLPPSAGSLGGAKELPFEADSVSYVFTNENGDYKIWAAPNDSTGYLKLNESIRLTDGKWHAPEELADLGNEDSDQIFPFMMADGVTLYFAEDGPDSMGGYDIMVATRDASDGTFLQPQNLGMPYNSPYDDYLLAIDELNGVGWWATDRNQLGDMVTVYLFKVNDLRSNYDPDDEDIAGRARAYDWQSTQDPEEDYSELLETVRAINPEAKARKIEFRLPMDKGTVYTAYTDFKSRTAATLMKKYMAEKKSLEENERQLAELRREYYDSRSNSLKSKIAGMESKIETQRRQLAARLSDIYRAERK